jgi:hypothetical protein
VAEAVLHNNPAAIHVVCQVITKRIAIQERRIAERHNDLVWLKLSQSGRAGSGVEQVNRDHIGFGLNF